jgi:hypothetical protein
MSPFLRIILISGIAVYCLECLIVLEYKNRAVAGGVLQQYHREYANGGSLKWRFGPDWQFDPRWPAYNFIETFGIFVYPVAIIGMAFSGFLIYRRQSRFLAIAALVVCVAVLLRFICLGVLSAVLGDI